MKQTRCIDDIICPYCGIKFDGEQAINGDMDASIVICPKCKREMEISISVEYMATSIEETLKKGIRKRGERH